MTPHFAWHGAFRYWQGNLRDVIGKLANDRHQQSFFDAREEFRRKIATLELVPYHAATFGIPPRIINQMHSVRLAKEFVQDVLLERAKQGNCLIVVTRKQKQWGLKDSSHVVVYNRSDAQAAHSSSNSKGGKAILKFLRST